MIRKPLAHALQRKKTTALNLKGYTPSAVLVPLVNKRGKYHILFTQRTDRVRDHKNQISFPGGVQEKGDPSLLVTALRETEEEIGLIPDKIEILGNLGDIFTPTQYRITPFVGAISSSYVIHPNPEEIKEVIEVPLSHLLEPRNLSLVPSEFFNRQFDMPYFYYKGHTIWGATGRITLNLINLLKDVL